MKNGQGMQAVQSGDDDLAVNSHPHVEQRNWQPGDDDELPSDEITIESFRRLLEPRVLRTLKRMRRLAQHLHPEDLADLLFPHVPVVQIIEASLYLEKVADCIDKKMREGQWKCVECGQDVWAKIKLTKDGLGLTREHRYVRRDAHYCSKACRQKAFRKRKRVTAKVSDTKAKPLRVTAPPSRRAA
jgi:hypothetical protein